MVTSATEASTANHIIIIKNERNYIAGTVTFSTLFYRICNRSYILYTRFHSQRQRSAAVLDH